MFCFSSVFISLIFPGDRRRKQAESQLVEVQAKLGEIERTKTELQEKNQKLQQEAENILQQLEEAEMRLVLPNKHLFVLQILYFCYNLP